ncbi:hypothetical protein CF336_g1858 [Tilletia laevis]|nr:hypothetical protein CF336_g1858 [Tilletia laevis]
MDPSSSRTPAPSSASTSTAGEPATTRAAPVIGALSAASHRMALRLAGARNELPPRPSPLTFKADAWASVLEGLGLSDRYADVIRGLREGVDLEILRITSTAIAINAPSANIHRSALREVILKERQRGAYIGPFQNAGDVQGVLHNSFQSMPLSLIPKPPDKFRLIQNFSANVGGSKATNDLIPRSWATTCSTFRQIWPALALRTEEGFFIDTRVSFGIGPGTGVFGRVGEAALDIFRARGFGPLGRWVDDILFSGSGNAPSQASTPNDPNSASLWLHSPFFGVETNGGSTERVADTMSRMRTRSEHRRNSAAATAGTTATKRSKFLPTT